MKEVERDGKTFGTAKIDERPRRGPWAPGNYVPKCSKCGQYFHGDKRAYHCADCEYYKVDPFRGSVLLANLNHAYALTDGTYSWPNSREGDMLRQAKVELEALLPAPAEIVINLTGDELEEVN